MPFLDQCVCCGGRSCAPLYRNLVSCRDCGHAWYPNIPERADLERIYNESYFQGDEYLDYELERSALEYNFRKRLKVLIKLHPAGGKLFEIGCSYGYFLYLAARNFEVEGCDISEHAIKQASTVLGPLVKHGDYLQMAIQPENAHVVCLWDTIEHLQRPDLVVAQAVCHLKRGGTLAISTGDIGSFFAHIRGPQWRLIHPPSHLHYFTRRSLSYLLTRSGLQLRFVRRPWFWRNAQAVAYRLLCAHPGTKTRIVYSLLHKHGYLDFCFPLNLGDLMDIYAYKP
jgi:2-polyprenyl-3-methyl-5-hydroxy-6-metoxy-1,4-benzoquinol methylase